MDSLDAKALGSSKEPEKLPDLASSSKPRVVNMNQLEEIKVEPQAAQVSSAKPANISRPSAPAERPQSSAMESIEERTMRL